MFLPDELKPYSSLRLRPNRKYYFDLKNFLQRKVSGEEDLIPFLSRAKSGGLTVEGNAISLRQCLRLFGDQGEKSGDLGNSFLDACLNETALLQLRSGAVPELYLHNPFRRERGSKWVVFPYRRGSV